MYAVVGTDLENLSLAITATSWAVLGCLGSLRPQLHFWVNVFDTIELVSFFFCMPRQSTLRQPELGMLLSARSTSSGPASQPHLPGSPAPTPIPRITNVVTYFISTFIPLPPQLRTGLSYGMR